MSTSTGALAGMVALLEQGMRDVDLQRYFTWSGLALLIYDHLLTFSDEIDLVWAAKASIAKKLFILNRYMVLASQLTVTYHINHFGSGSISDEQCKALYSLVFVYGVISLASANFLVLLRVITLWDRNATVAKLMLLCFAICESMAFGFMIYVLVQTVPSFRYEPLVYSCIVTYKSHFFAAVWAAFLLFELIVITAVLSNALYRPRSIDTPLRRVLTRDGIFYFITIAVLRTVNVFLAVFGRTGLIAVCVFIVWAINTTVLNRALLRIQKASVNARERSGSSFDAGRAGTPGDGCGSALGVVMSKATSIGTIASLPDIPMTRMSTTGTGGTDPIVGGKGDRGRAGARRVHMPVSTTRRPGTADSDVKYDSDDLSGDVDSTNVNQLEPRAGMPWSIRFSRIGQVKGEPEKSFFTM